MTGPRTQFETVYRPLVGPLFSTAGFQEIRREPIPWCTTHNNQLHGKLGEDAIEGLWQIWCLFNDSDMPCVVSTGGPDHKWWRDGD